MGHTPSFDGMLTRCNGSLIVIDTGISRAYVRASRVLHRSTGVLTRRVLQGGVLSALEIAFSLHPRPLASPKDTMRTWIEKEVVTVLQIDADKRIVARDERPLDLPVSLFG
jgi:methylthioribose-1-phosphate isomerase